MYWDKLTSDRLGKTSKAVRADGELPEGRRLTCVAHTRLTPVSVGRHGAR